MFVLLVCNFPNISFVPSMYRKQFIVFVIYVQVLCNGFFRNKEEKLPFKTEYKMITYKSICIHFNLEHE